jgi:site-specific DNA recombinase
MLESPLVNEAGNDSGTALLGGAAAGSNKNPLVEVPGIEPGSFVASSGLLRAQLTMPLLGPTDHVSKLV